MRSSRPLRPHLTIFLSLMLLAGLAGCGPASDNAPNLGSRASVAGSPVAQKNPAPRSNPATQVASPMPLDSDNESSSASVKGGIPGVDSSSQGDRLQSHLADTPNGKSVPLIPDSIIKDLNSPDPRVRLQAMSHWGSRETTAPLDPLFEAMDDEDPAVQAKAIEIIERYWGVEEERERK